MRRSVMFLIIAMLSIMLSGCIISKSPTATDVTTTPGATTTFSIIVFPSASSYTWTLDGSVLGNTESSYQYTPMGGEHTLSVTATHLLGVDTQTWSILDAEVVESVDASGGLVAVTDTESPIVGAQADIPAGALDATVNVTISQAEMPAGLPGQAAGACVQFGPDGTQFSEPVDLFLPYNDSNNDGIVDKTGVPERYVTAKYFNETTQDWEDVQVLDRDANKNLIAIRVTHFSEYATTVPVLTWNKTYGVSGVFYSVRQTSDGGFIAAGFTSTDAGGMDLWLVKVDAAGTEEWSKTFGGSGEDMASSVSQTSEGGYIVAGYTTSFGAGGQDGWLIKTDASGTAEWDKTFGGAYDDYFMSIQQTNDGGYILAGTTTKTESDPDIWLLKTDAEGTQEWEKTFGGPSVDDVASSVQQTSDGGYVLVGCINGTGGQLPTTIDVLLLKTSADGSEEWSKTFDGSSSDLAYAVKQTEDGGYVFGGCAMNADNEYHAWLVKTDSDGEQTLNKTYDDAQDIVIMSVQPLAEGGYILVGYDATGSRGWLRKVDADGDVVWTKTLDDGTFIASDQIANDDGYILAGMADGYGWLVKTDAEGNAQQDGLLDSDDDGRLDVDEVLFGTNPNDADTDDDGLMDGVEDSNRNGVVDIWETDPSNVDTDGDGIQDGTELGITTAGLGTDTAIFQPDLDPTTTTSELSSDTDGDGISDGVEDANHNGRVDTGESDPNAGNRPPVANAGQNRTVVPNFTVTLDGSGSTDPDNDIVSYHWQQTNEPAVILTNADTAIAKFTADVAVGSTLTFELTVIDATGLQSTDTCVITINDPISILLNSLVHIPGGSFRMGSTDDEDGYANLTTPVHTVTLESFDIGAYEVTQAQYLAVMGTNPSYFQGTSYPDTENNPVEQVSWEDARAFCTELSAMTGRTFTLPSEAQWEYACRAGTTTLYSFGNDDDLLADYAWYDDYTHSITSTREVGTKLPNLWGLYDMHGNIREWCLDSWHSNYNDAPTDGSAWEPETGTHRIHRGGMWSDFYYTCRSANRNCSYPTVSDKTLGFRIVAVPIDD